MSTIMRDVRSMAQKANLEILGHRESKHLHVEVRAPDGRTGTIIVGRSDSDHRARKNQLARFKRFAQGRKL